MIFIAHAWHDCMPKSEAVECLGMLGVQIFFAISGYLIACRYSDKNFDNVWLDGIRYSWKKIKKFYPLHIITFAIFFLDKIYNNFEINFLSVALEITLTKAWHPTLFSNFNGAAWFLSAIVFIYLLVPFTVNFFKKFNTAQLFMLLVVLFFCRITLESLTYRELFNGESTYFFLFYPSPIYRYTDFLFGYIGAVILNSGKFNLEFSTSAVQIFLFAAYITGCVFFNAYTQFCWLPSMFLILSVLIFYFVNKKGAANYLTGNFFFVHLGNISFELFLIHYVVVALMPNYVNLELSGLSTMAVLFLTTIITAEIFHKIPFIGK